MTVSLLSHTELKIASHAIRTCYQSFHKGDDGGEIDCELIDKVGNKMRHSSTLEHLVYSFYIAGVSRALLQELARHRIASLSVKSTRYTLKELKNEPPFSLSGDGASKYIVLTRNEAVDRASINALENLRQLIADGVALDAAKYALPECYKTELTYTINARSLQNLLSLRSSKAALKEFRELSKAIFNAIPNNHRFIFAEFINSDES